MGLRAEAWLEPLPAGRAVPKGICACAKGLLREVETEWTGTVRGWSPEGRSLLLQWHICLKGYLVADTVFLNIEAQKASKESTGTHLAASTKTPLCYIPFQSSFFLRR